MKNVIVTTAIAVAAGGVLSYAQAAKQTTPHPQVPPAPDAAASRERDGLSDLDAMTFSCPKAALNAAAREAARVPSKGTYQFSYFKIVNYSHHSSYEIHFKSNYQGEPDLKYCVAIYCQEGWDPKNTEMSVTLMGNERQRETGAAHGGNCGEKHAVMKRQSKQ